MLQEQNIPINLTESIDTKTDPKLVVAGKFIRLENAVFTNVGRLTKRNGYGVLSNVIAGAGTLSAPNMVKSYNNQVIAADSQTILSYSPSQAAWNIKGGYTSTDLSRVGIDQEHPASGYADNAILGNYALYGWSTAVQGGSGFPTQFPSVTYGSVVDLTSGDVLIGPVSLSSSANLGATPVKCVLLGGTTLAIIYRSFDITSLQLRTVVFSGGGVVTFSAATSISTNLAIAPLPANFDVVPTPTGAVIVYPSTTGVTVSTLDTTGAVTHTSNIVDATRSVELFNISITPTNNNVWIYWADITTGGGLFTSLSIEYAVFTPILGVVLGKTLVAAVAAPFAVSNMVAVPSSATQQILYYGQYVQVGITGTSGYVDYTSSISTTDAGVVGAPGLFANGITPYSHSFSIPFSSGTQKYAVFVYRGANLTILVGGVDRGQAQPTFFLVQLPSTIGPALAITRFGAGVANLQNILSTVIGYSPEISFISAMKILFACGIETQEFLSDFYSTFEFFPGGLAGVFAYTIDFNSNDSYRAINSGELSILNGGLIKAYDGQNVTEFGYHLFPEIEDLHPSNTGGSVADGTYSYLAIFQWTDAQGNFHQSAPSLAKSVTTVGANSVDVTVTTAYLSEKIGVSVAIYRTQSLGTAYFQITDPIFLISASPNVASVTFHDIFSDAQIAGNPPPYTSPGSPVLENSTPPPSIAMLAHNNRLWFVNSESKNEIWYTKSFSSGTGLSPSALMTEQIDPRLGDIVGLGEMDEKIVGFKQYGFFAQSGDGVNDVGSGSTLSFPQFIPSDVGLSTLKSIITIPTGIMFKSFNGVYILDRSLNAAYIGASVEAYNNQVITSSNLVPTTSQVRFLVSGGLTLVYDYIFNKWSTFTNHSGLSADVWQGVYVYATTNGNIYKETPGTYTDNGVSFSLLAQTSWLALASVQGFQRVRRLEMLGDFTNGASANHKIQIQAAYDFSSTFSAPIPYTFGVATASGTFQYRERLPQQKCDAISLLIQEVTTGDAAEYLDLTNLSFEAGVKKGLNKLAAAQSVG